jgi:hypothetical protein
MGKEGVSAAISSTHTNSWGELSQHCIHCSCTISRSRRERMREGGSACGREGEAGKITDFSLRVWGIFIPQ